MTDDTFYATLKLVTGEELLAEVSLCDESGEQFFLVTNPIVIAETTNIDYQKGVAVSGLIPKKWMLYSSDDMTIIYKSHVVSISELDKFGVDFYNQALIAAKLSSPIKKKVDSKDNLGYVGTTKEYRKELERMYELSMDVSDDPLS
jgi:hypothetical protein